MQFQFWKYKPIKVLKNVGCIGSVIDEQTLLAKVVQDIKSSPITLDYNVIDLTDHKIQTCIVNFINNNYEGEGEDVHFRYTVDLFKYYATLNCLGIVFYPKGSQRIVGFIAGAQHTLVLKGDSRLEIDSIDVNFLCLVQQLRNLHLTSYMISVLTKECIERLGIIVATYTTGNSLRSPSFCVRKY